MISDKTPRAADRPMVVGGGTGRDCFHRPVYRSPSRMTRAERLDAFFWRHPLVGLLVIIWILGGAFFALLKWLLT